MRGRKPDPRTLRAVKGNPQNRPLPEAPAASTDPMVAPSWLPARAQEHFADLAEEIAITGHDSATYSQMLALAALRLAEIESLNEVLAEGSTHRAKNTRGAVVPKAHPAAAMRDAAMKHLQSLLSEFGLSPSSATRVVPGKPQTKANPFSALRGGKGAA